VTFLVINAFVKVLRISKKAANNARTITTLSSGNERSTGKPRMKLREEGIGTSEIMFKPKEVTTAMSSNPARSNIEIKNWISPRQSIFLLSDLGKRSNISCR
jgi:hypothetical protein